MGDEKPTSGKPIEKPLPQRPDPSLVQIVEKGDNSPKETRRD